MAAPSRSPACSWFRSSRWLSASPTTWSARRRQSSASPVLKLFSRYQEVDGYNDLDSPPGGVPDVAFDIASFDDTKLWTSSVELEYRLTDVWRISLGGWIEQYEIRDAQTTGIGNYMPGGFFLAPNDSDYDGNVLYLRASYRR